MTDQASSYRWIEGQGEAFGWPGVEPRWTSSRKDCIGMAYSASSRIWYTVSHGILNEIYYPTIDRPQTRDMEFLLTDGETFVHEEKRDLLRTFEYIDSCSSAVRLINADPQGRYKITKEIIADPHHPVVLMRVRLEGNESLLSRMKAYALLAPHLDVGGADNSGSVLDLSGKLTLLASKNGLSLVMAASCGFTRASCGFVGRSDGWQDLMDNFQMDWQFGTAFHGNIALTGEIDLSLHREFVVAISLGEGHHSALTTALSSVTTPFDQHLKRFNEQWHRAASPVALKAASMDAGRLVQVSQNVILSHEDKYFSGAFIASASIPWGQHKSDDDVGGYHLVWTRDMVQSATALLACGRVDTARRALVYLACTQKPDGSFAQNFWIDGTPYWKGIQLDEVAFPLILAWRLWKLNGLGDFDVAPFVERAAGFLVRHAPVTQQERWEEAAGYSPSTLAVVISSLICAAEMARAHEYAEVAVFLEEHADWIEAHLEDWTVTNNGSLLPGVPRHYMRIRPPQCGDSYALDTCGDEIVRINNRGPGERVEFEARNVVDGGFLELVRYGVRRPDDPVVVDSIKVIDHVLKVETPVGPCWRRYNHDGYGQRHDGGPFLGWGQGRAWPLLTGERAHYEFAAGHDVTLYIQTLEGFSSRGGMLPEQIWDAPDIPERGLKLGKPTGAAMPLVWAHAEYIKLLRSVTDGQVYDRISVVAERYGRVKRSTPIEIFRLDRQVQSIPAGRRLRMLAQDHFLLLWTDDDWKTVRTTESRRVGCIGHFADMDTQASIAGRVIFTMKWSLDNRWEGRNYEVRLDPVKPEIAAMPETVMAHASS
ncbi:MAG TPA: glycoside hydrolase family 15 protein [Acidobacteriaceae bacterium]|nr:glycoside hydrolase family 15 protein [Acidobacteriaceae bacterium]